MENFIFCALKSGHYSYDDVTKIFMYSVFKYKSNSISNLIVSLFFQYSFVQADHLPHVQFRKESQKILKTLIYKLNIFLVFHFLEIYFSWFCCFSRNIADVMNKKVILSFFFLHQYIKNIQNYHTCIGYKAHIQHIQPSPSLVYSTVVNNSNIKFLY